MIQLRAILPKDNPEVKAIVQQVLMEMGAPKVGTAYADPFLGSMYENYNKPRHAYFVIESNSQIIGCAGVGQLEGAIETVCELQKMYFLPQARGKGLGTQMMQLCLEKAKAFGYEKCYLETMPYMQDAQKLYLKSGFTYLDQPMGCTGHTSCPVWMIKAL
ncbi:GNAT family N-acetyltransferase [Flavobacterium branchiophilum]|uniref:Probable acetyltransferase YjgM n=1 Tax=Flavobacterium branchiophilum (strain FL-15) TaxID=1034807 RepID=G2Z5B9_FLABF|nr:GNAT family N-acetyltransferase [Flavobacterium branchiophilum]CCB68626.1 Probable acetyltransferase YjgM [Flavobacterium branchiophilum FL-15]